MIIPGNPPQLRPNHFVGHLQVCYLKDGRVVIKKWPRARGEPKSPVTIAQVAVWDMAQNMVKRPEPSEYSIALQETKGTAFYARDILICAMYGNYISFPGWGFAPGGPGTAKQHGGSG
jgi:hypothetical protein